MFKKYGVLGVVLILVAELSIFFKINFILEYFFPIVWWGFILLIDAIVFKLQKNSLISTRFSTFISLVIISAPLWYIFDLYNLFFYSNWQYVIGIPNLLRPAFGMISFATVFPAIFETADFLKALHLERYAADYVEKKKIKIPKIRIKINKILLFSMIILGLVCLIIPFTMPKSPLALLGWVGFFLLLDPINYMHNDPSIISYIKKRKFLTPLAYFIAGYICGFFWEFWNYWARTKWYYTVPHLGPKIFEMPILGYLPYGFFALEVFSMYYFTRGLFIRAEEKIKKKFI